MVEIVLLLSDFCHFKKAGWIYFFILVRYINFVRWDQLGKGLQYLYYDDNKI